MSDLDFSDEFQIDCGPIIVAQPPSSPLGPGIRAEAVYKDEDASLFGITQHIPEAGVHLRKPRKFRRTPSGMVDCQHVLRKTFGKSDFKGEQQKIVEAAVLGADVFVVAPTGMGKSLCFQIPAVADTHGITIVISPLLALMKNQVTKLQELGVPAISFTSETQSNEKAAIVKDLESGHPTSRLLYITPEKLMSSDFCTLLAKVYEQRELSRLVIDEAHCISEWGHDFRAEYRKLGTFRDRFPDVPIMALTASATPMVQEDIITNLNMSTEHLFKVVRYLPFLPAPDSQYAAIYDYISDLTRKRGFPSCGIIYARTRQSCDELAEFLKGKGTHARPYHRGVPRARLDATLRDWSEGNRCDVVVATVCFGMGIDKADVRYIIHLDLPQSFEGYYQETGRAGRDGLPSKCILYYSREDVVKIKKLVRNGHAARERRNIQIGGMPPSQRAPDSLDQVCKYPDKTKKNKAALSSDEFISTQRPMLEHEAIVNPNDLDEEDVDGYPAPRVQSNGIDPAGPSWKQPSGAVNNFHPSKSHNVPNPTRFMPATVGSKAKPRNGSFVPAKDGFWHTDAPGGAGGVTMRRLASGPNETGSEEGVISRLKPVRKGSEMEIDQADGPKAKKLRQTVLSSHTMPQRRGAGPGGFKVPFKTNSSSASASKVPQEIIVISDGEADTIPDSMEPSPIVRTTSSHSLYSLGSPTSMDRLTPEPVLEHDYVGSSPVKFDTETGDVEAASSRKIPLQIRQETAQKLRTGLHKGLMVGLRGEDYWVKLEADNLNQNERHVAFIPRSDVLLEAARQLEFFIWSYSVSERGYKLGASKRLAAIRLLATSDLGSLLSSGRSSRTNDSGRMIAEPNVGPEVEKEDIDEVARILQKQVQAAFKKDGRPKGSQAVSQSNFDEGNERLRNPGSTPSISTPPLQ
ncbi:hypothetical protein FRC05_001926 [Tulasnella sp. 425]|nr:hypothetical protein FRC05_001926 [Tulasnella sp. 425]